MDAKYIQNRPNWCWAVACKMVGEQYKQTQWNSGCGFESIGTDDISQEEIVKNANI